MAAPLPLQRRQNGAEDAGRSVVAHHDDEPLALVGHLDPWTGAPPGSACDAPRPRASRPHSTASAPHQAGLSSTPLRRATAVANQPRGANVRGSGA